LGPSQAPRATSHSRFLKIKPSLHFMRTFVRGIEGRLKDFILGRDSRKVVFRAEGCGLANRLRALVGYQALARLHKLPFYLTWTADPTCPSQFKDLFDSPINLVYRRALWSIRPRAIYREAIWFENIWKRWGTGIDWVTFLKEVRKRWPGRAVLMAAERGGSERPVPASRYEDPPSSSRSSLSKGTHPTAETRSNTRRLSPSPQPFRCNWDPHPEHGQSGCVR
jgi:hypothetical protein